MQIQTQAFLLNLDQNRNGFVSLKELQTLDGNRDGQISEQESSSQIAKDDLNQINQILKQASNTVKNFAFLEQVTQEMPVFSSAALNSTLFPQGVAGINPNDIQQGGLGDCFFLSSLASLAKHRPASIINMITDLGNGNYSVKFPGAKYAIKVSSPTDDWKSGSGFDPQNNANGSQWVSVLEKAFVDYVLREESGTIKTAVTNTADTLLGVISPIGWLGKKVVNAAQGPTQKDPREYFKWGGFQGDAMKILTGNSCDDDILAATRNSTTRSKLKQHLAKGNMITASTAGAGSSAHNLMSKHVYSVLAYDEGSDTLTIRNPYGSGSDAVGLTHKDTQNDGIFKMTLDEFNRYFNFISYESR